MAVQVHEPAYRRLSADALVPWRDMSAAGVSDCQERAMAMDGGIGPLDPSKSVVGQARTVRCMVGDNSALHVALTVAGPGDVLVADAGGFLGTAVWGGLMTQAALRAGIAALIVDGAVRDSAEIVDLGFPCFARGRTPAGPHKAFGGAVDAPISCGGVAVHPGDLIVADADGVTVVPLDRVEAVATAYAALRARETEAEAALAAGRPLSEVYGVPPVAPA